MIHVEPKPPTKTEHEPPIDLSDPAQVRTREGKAKAYDRRRIAGLKFIVNNDDARLWLWDLVSACGSVGGLSFGQGNDRTNFNEGMRNVGNNIQADLVKHFPESYLLMMRENKERSE